MDVGALVLEVCQQTVGQDYLLARQQRARWNGMAAAVRTGDTPFLFAWLVEVFSYQGIADARALAYMDVHGRLTHGDVARGLEAGSGLSQARNLLALRRVRLHQDGPELRGTRPAAQLPPTPAQSAQRSPQPDGLRAVPIHPRGLRWRSRALDR